MKQDLKNLKSRNSVLVLNFDYTPLNITHWKRAAILLLKNKAQILSESVIRLLNYVRIPVSRMIHQKPSKSMIYKRDGNKCQYCSATKNLTIDHVIPKCQGGTDCWDNLVLACSRCNAHKSNKLLEQTNMRLLRKPRAPLSPVFLSLSQVNCPEWNVYTF